tara:strand:- start:291 stop:464 length:174 start_codon:yes stop_codon:yes gene_type:complete
MSRHVGQWYWSNDWLGNKSKAWYFGPRLDWMFLDKYEKQKEREKNEKRRRIKTNTGT